MMRKKPTTLTDYEEKDALWWCRHYKIALADFTIRVDQYFKAETDEEREVTKGLIYVLINNFQKDEIGITVPYNGEKDVKEDE